MPHTGTLVRVVDKSKGWSLLIDTDEKGDTWFTIWDRKLAGEASEEHEAECDVHKMVGERVTFEAKIGKLKDKDGPDDGERWNSEITAIALEDSGPDKSVREMAEEFEEAERIARLQAEVAAIEAEIELEEAETVQAHECAQIHDDGKYDRLRAATMDMLGSVGKWTAEVERLLKEV